MQVIKKQNRGELHGLLPPPVTKYVTATFYPPVHTFIC